MNKNVAAWVDRISYIYYRFKIDFYTFLEGNMKKYICLFLLMMVLPLSPAKAEHYDYDAITQTHRQCLTDCEDERERGIEGLSCDYYATQSAYRNCERTASSTRSTCIGNCNSVEDRAIDRCQETYRDTRKECRVEKREDKQECRDAKKAEKEICKQEKIDEKEACKELSGNAERECKKQARQNKADCKKQVRETKKACKEDAREEKAECKDDSREARENCISQAESISRACRSQCNATYDAACTEQRQAANACAALANPFFRAEEVCKEVCNDERDEALEGYNGLCPNQHGGDQGGEVTFSNQSGEVRYYYKNGQRVTAMSNGSSYTETVACGVSFRADFKRQDTETSDFVGTTHIVGPFPCCEEAQSITLPINPNGSR